MSTANERQRIVTETTNARDKAESLLRGLLDARASSAKSFSAVSPKAEAESPASVDAAIRSTQRMIEALNRAIDRFRGSLSDDDLELLRQTLGEDAQDASAEVRPGASSRSRAA
ncbi:MAG: hypothetical protein AAGG07_00100 [Planctomycetota bacterium]